MQAIENTKHMSETGICKHSGLKEVKHSISISKFFPLRTQSAVNQRVFKVFLFCLILVSNYPLILYVGQH